jgi:hypothetical protein
VPTVIVGSGFTVTFVVADAVQPAAEVTTTVYVPAAAAVTLLIDGFWLVLVNPFGPLHE